MVYYADENMRHAENPNCCIDIFKTPKAWQSITNLSLLKNIATYTN